jgi:hypothetical protein
MAEWLVEWFGGMERAGGWADGLKIESKKLLIDFIESQTKLLWNLNR